VDDIAWFSVTRLHLGAVDFVIHDVLKELPPEEGWPLLLEHIQAMTNLQSQNQGVSNG